MRVIVVLCRRRDGVVAGEVSPRIVPAGTFLAAGDHHPPGGSIGLVVTVDGDDTAALADGVPATRVRTVGPA
ncbi:MAG: hypothetical protein ACYDEN_06270 [Acidimicrobiales bacterium]